jgi:hypothetical protein
LAKYLRRSKFASQSGQAVLEYTLLIAVIAGVFLLVVRPGMDRIKQELGKTMQSGLFSNEPGKANFYYFPMR